MTPKGWTAFAALVAMTVPPALAQQTAPAQEPAPAQQPAEVGYQSFVIDTGAIAADAEASTLVDAARRQIDLVLRVGLSAPTLAVLRGFPIHLGRGPGGGHFGRDGVFVNLSPGQDDRPILLHELIHAYQARLLPGGRDNPELKGFFAAAQAPGVWPARSYMLSNINEYFAMTASVFLNGSAARPPFTRAALEAKQPDYAAWLGRTIK